MAVLSVRVSTGVGKFLMAVAERIAKLYGIYELSVISGVGVRNYYRRLGYGLLFHDGCQWAYGKHRDSWGSS